MFTKPRDFTKGIFKFRTTPLGSLPTEADLMRTIRTGVSGTMMPTFASSPRLRISPLPRDSYIASISCRPASRFRKRRSSSTNSMFSVVSAENVGSTKQAR